MKITKNGFICSNCKKEQIELSATHCLQKLRIEDSKTGRIIKTKIENDIVIYSCSYCYMPIDNKNIKKLRKNCINLKNN